MDEIYTFYLESMEVYERENFKRGKLNKCKYHEPLCTFPKALDLITRALSFSKSKLIPRKLLFTILTLKENIQYCYEILIPMKRKLF